MKKLMAANWKMFKTCAQAADTLTQLADALGGRCPEGREVLVFPPFTALESSAIAMAALQGGMIGGQDVYPADEGAFTGEISPQMLLGCGAQWVLTGHSERRMLQGESDVLVGRKTAFALSRGLRVVMCVGETLEQREAGMLGEVLAHQLRVGLTGLRDSFDPDMVAVAYEPIWAIGTGRSARTEDIVDAHALARDIIKDNLGANSLKIRLLYGGSVKADNAATILSLDNVDGVLVGGASLQADTFTQIVTAGI